MTLALEEHWVCDARYVREGDLWDAFFLPAPKSLGDPDLRHWNVSVGQATSRDLRAWDHLGACFAPSDGEAWDDHATWTGSVVPDEDGAWPLVYTGARRDEEGLEQRIGHATSRDLHRWERVGTEPCLDLGPDRYEERRLGFRHDRALRDPWVMRDPEGEGWLMVFTARVPDVAAPDHGGAIGLATSPDLHDWTLHPPVFSGGFERLEVPQVRTPEDRWFCLFGTAAAHVSREPAEATPGGPVTGTHSRIGEGPRGPFLDGGRPPRRHAGRILRAKGGPVLLGFADRPDGVPFQGPITDPDPVEVTPDGLLRVVVRGPRWPGCSCGACARASARSRRSAASTRRSPTASSWTSLAPRAAGCPRCRA